MHVLEEERILAPVLQEVGRQPGLPKFLKREELPGEPRVGRAGHGRLEPTRRAHRLHAVA